MKRYVKIIFLATHSLGVGAEQNIEHSKNLFLDTLPCNILNQEFNEHIFFN